MSRPNDGKNAKSEHVKEHPKKGAAHPKKKGGAKMQFAMKSREKFSVVAAHLKNVTHLLKRQKELTASKAEFDRKYIAVDLKGVSGSPYDDGLKLVQRELDFARQSVRAALGTQTFRLRMWENILLSSTAGGVCAGAFTCDPQNLTEFSSAAALFDEYRVVSGLLKFAVMGTTTNNATSINPMAVMAYDPTDNSALTQVTDGCQLQQHALIVKPIQPTGAISVTPSGPHDFHWRIPEGVLQYGSASSMSSSWQATLSTLTKLPYGYFKVYADALTVSVSGMGGVNEYHVEFRCRG